MTLDIYDRPLVEKAKNQWQQKKQVNVHCEIKAKCVQKKSDHIIIRVKLNATCMNSKRKKLKMMKKKNEKNMMNKKWQKQFNWLPTFVQEETEREIMKKTSKEKKRNV